MRFTHSVTLALALAPLFLSGGCKLKGKSTPGSDMSGTNALLSGDGRTLLFMSVGLAEQDAREFNLQVERGNPKPAPGRPLPVCFYRARGLTPDEVRLMSESKDGVFALPPETFRNKVHALRSTALDNRQASILVTRIAHELALPPAAVRAVFSPDVVRSQDVGVSPEAFAALETRIANDVPDTPEIDYSGEPCGTPQTPPLALAWSPLVQKSIIIFARMSAMFGNVDDGVLLFAKTGEGLANTNITSAYVVKGKDLLKAMPLQYAPRGKIEFPMP